MAFVLPRDFVKETTTVTGTGPATLLGARAPGQRFNAVCSNGDTVDYAISHQTSNEWEVGTGTYNANVLTRTTILDSSNGGAAVSFSAGTKSVDLVDTSARISRRVGPVVIGATSLGLGSLSFSNLNGVSFGLSTDSAGGTITGSVLGGGGGGLTLLSTNQNTNLSLYTDSAFTGANLVFPLHATSDSSNFSSANVVFAWSTTGSSLRLAGVATLGFFGLNSTGGGQVLRAQAMSIRASNGIRVTLHDSTFAALGRIPVYELAHDGIRSMQLQGLGTSISAYTLSTATASNINLQVAFTSNDSAISFQNVSWRFGANGASNDLVGAAAIGFIGADTAGGGALLSAQYMSIRQVNGVSVTLHDSTFAGFGRIPIYDLSVPPRIGLVSHVGGNSASNVTRLAFSNASNVTFSLSTAAGAATLFASVAAGGGGGADGFGTISLVSGFSSTTPTITDATDSSITGSALAFPLMATAQNTVLSFHNVSFRLSSNTLLGAAWVNFLGGAAGAASAQNISFVNSNGMSFSVGTTTAAGFGRIAQVSVSANLAFSAGTLFQFASRLGFADAPGLSWSYAGSQITAVPLNSGLHVVSDTVTSNNFSRLAFGTGNGMTLGISTGASAATVTGSYTVPTLTSLSFSNLNGVSFGIAGSTLTASISSLSFSNLNGISFGIAGSTLTASQSTLSFSNANGVSFGIAGSTLTASVLPSGGGVTLAGFRPYEGGILVTNQGLGNAQLWINPMAVPAAFTFDRVALMLSILNTSNSSGTHTLRMGIGIYTRNGSSLSLLDSSTGSTSIVLSGTQGNYSQFSGARLWTMSWGDSLPAGDYWLGVITSLSTGGANAGSFSLGMLSQSANGFGLGILGGAGTNDTVQIYLGKGIHKTTQSVPPSSLAFSQLGFGTTNSVSSVAWRLPFINFASGTA